MYGQRPYRPVHSSLGVPGAQYILSDNGLKFWSNLSLVVYELLSICAVAISSYHARGVKGGVERANHTTALILAMAVNERQGDWGAQLPHAEFTSNKLASTATGLALQRSSHFSRLPRPPLSPFSITPGSPAMRA